MLSDYLLNMIIKKKFPYSGYEILSPPLTFACYKVRIAWYKVYLSQLWEKKSEFASLDLTLKNVRIASFLAITGFYQSSFLQYLVIVRKKRQNCKICEKKKSELW